jgi:hypothetical protein
VVRSKKRWLGLFSCLLFAVSMEAQPPMPSDEVTRRLALDIFKQLIEINTTDSVGSVTAAAEAMAQRFRDAGFPESDIQVLGPSSNDRKKNVVVRLHGSGKHKPVLLIGHLDVVEARREDWTTDPFQFIEKDGYYYGRGTSDMKDGDAIMSATLIRMKKEGYAPSRDIILAMTADEEGGTSNGVEWLIKNHREWIDAEFVLNHDGGGVLADHGDESGRAQFPAAAGKCNLRTGGCVDADPGLPVPVRVELDYSRILRAAGEDVDGAASGGSNGNAEESSRHGGRGATVEGSHGQLDLAHHLRGDAVERGPCQQRAAANGAGERELPHRTRAFAGGNPADAGEGSGRPENQSAVPREQ